MFGAMGNPGTGQPSARAAASAAVPPRPGSGMAGPSFPEWLAAQQQAATAAGAGAGSSHLQSPDRPSRAASGLSALSVPSKAVRAPFPLAQWLPAAPEQVALRLQDPESAQESPACCIEDTPLGSLATLQYA